eukprot:jgi/Mesvir1/19295/Mv10369-RA.2
MSLAQQTTALHTGRIMAACHAAPATSHCAPRSQWWGKSVSARGAVRVVSPLPGRGDLVVRNVGWDPEGILAAPKAGHIARRMMMKNDDLRKQAEAEADRLMEIKAKEREERRAGRVVPTTDKQTLQYFLETEAEDMEYEVARRRERLTDAFFKYLDTEIGVVRFSTNTSEAVLAEMENLRTLLRQGVSMVDAMSSELVSAKAKLASILTAKDKKAALLELAGQNAIDGPLLNLIGQNAEGARQAGQQQAAEFLDKLKAAAAKYVVATPKK